MADESEVEDIEDMSILMRTLLICNEEVGVVNGRRYHVLPKLLMTVKVVVVGSIEGQREWSGFGDQCQGNSLSGSKGPAQLIQCD